LEEKNANAIFFQNLYRMQIEQKKKQNPQKEMTKKQTQKSF